ncbi:MAG: phosphodiester glycosidase family protein [Thermoguttaceae bacterium]|nr:phosphodiester glycosidase family protein [Thermoguttaceae bacterium]
MKKLAPFPFSSTRSLRSLRSLRLSAALFSAVAVVGLADFTQTAPFNADFAPVAARADEPKEAAILWEPIYRGVEYARLSVETPVLNKWQVVKIDLQARGVEFVATGRNPNYEPEKRETWRQTTADFLDENNLAVAVNANFYNPFNAESIRTQGDSNLLGFGANDGVLVSKPEPGRPAFVVYKNKTAAICDLDPNISDEEVQKIQAGVAGSNIVLQNGVVPEIKNKDRHPRTAVGISEDGRYVFLLIVDGRQPKHSVGATLTEVGETLKYFGAHIGLNLDGGGSTTLVCRGADGASQVLNSPANSGVPRNLRNNANSIGVRADAVAPSVRARFEKKMKRAAEKAQAEAEKAQKKAQKEAEKAAEKTEQAK